MSCWLDAVATSSVAQGVDRAETNALYDSMLREADDEGCELTPLSGRVKEQIQIDMNRTTSLDGVLFQLSPRDDRDRLERVLHASVKLHPHLGYVQGMHEVAGKMLECLAQDGIPSAELEYSCFYLLRVMFDLVPDYWSANLVGTQVDASILNELLQQRLPVLFQLMCADFGMDVGVLVLPWLIALFAQSFPADFLRPAWTYLLEVGRPALVYISMAVVEWLEPTIKGCNGDFSKIVKVCQGADTLWQASTRNMTASNAAQIVHAARTRISDSIELAGGFGQLSRVHLARVQESLVEREMRQVNWLRSEQEITLTDNEVDEIKRDFLAERDTIDGVSMDGFQTVVSKHKGDAFAALSTELLFRVWDTDGNGVLGLAELMLGLSAFAHGTSQDRMRLAFNAFDRDKDGRLSLCEYSDLCWKLMLLHEHSGGPTKQGMQAIVEMLFASFDQDGNGEISLDEFVVGALAQPALMKCFSATIQINTELEPLAMTAKCTTQTKKCVPHDCVVA